MMILIHRHFRLWHHPCLLTRNQPCWFLGSGLFLLHMVFGFHALLDFIIFGMVLNVHLFFYRVEQGGNRQLRLT